MTDWAEMETWFFRETRFFSAVDQGDIATVRELGRQYPLLLTVGAYDANGERDKHALHKAARAKNCAMVEALIELGADVERCDAFGITPLMHAAQVGDAPLAGVLLGAGASPFHNTHDGITPLMFAAQAGGVDAARLFLQQGISVNARRDCGMTALHFARSAENRHETVSFLIEAGADPALTNVADDTPAMLAARMGDKTYGDAIAVALRQKDIKEAAKAMTDQKDRAVLEQGLPEAFAVRKPLSYKPQ